MTYLRPIYSHVARAWTASELDAQLAAALARGQRDLDAEERTGRPVAHLATAIPRLVSLAVASNALELASGASGTSQSSAAKQLIETIDRTAAGALHRCHSALQMDAAAVGYDAGEHIETARDLAGELLERLSPDSEVLSIGTQAQEAGRWTAIAIDLLDRGEHAAYAEAIADSLGRLLVVNVFADAASRRLTVTTGRE